ncbi:MAG: MmgE/PrpD family protein [Rhodospirillales bacterium]
MPDTPKSPPPATRLLAEFAADLSYDALPDRIQELMPILLTDLFRAAAVGRTMPWVEPAERVQMSLSGAPTSSIFFSDERADPVRAAYINGVIAGSLDWDDSHIAAIIHPGIVIWPAALAVAEKTKASGRALVEAVTAGYEGAIRIGIAGQPDHSLRGFQGTPTCGTFGAAIASARLLGLDAKGIQNAIGIAASYAGGISQFFVSGSDVKRLHAGKAAAHGIEAALMAQTGLSGPPDAIEGRQGFGPAFSDSFDAAVIERDLGSHYWIDSICLKVHAGTVRLQAAIEAAEQLVRQGVTPDRIERVEIGVPQLLMGKLTWNEPVDHQQAQMSAPFAVAMTFMLAPERPDPFVLGIDDFGVCVKEAPVRDLSKRTVCVVDDAIDKQMTKEYVPARVSVFLKDGKRLDATVIKPRGCPDNPITADEVRERFRLMAGRYMAETVIERWLEAAGAVHTLPSAADLMRWQP